jgi:hypothetical protein
MCVSKHICSENEVKCKYRKEKRYTSRVHENQNSPSLCQNCLALISSAAAIRKRNMSVDSCF